MRRIVVAKLLGVTLLVLYLVVGLTRPPSVGQEANRSIATSRCT